MSAPGHAPSVGGVWRSATSASPSARIGAATAYDARHSRVVLFGGIDAETGTALDDTWTWNGTAWQRLDVPAPPARGYAGMGWDGARVVLFGGQATRGGSRWYSDTWTWDGARWSRTRATGPAARSRAAFGWDGSRLVLTGGWNPLAAGSDRAGDLGDSWSWDRTRVRWTRIAGGPGARRDAAAAFDRSSGGLLVHGGTNGRVLLNDTWLLSGGRWRRVAAQCTATSCVPAGAVALSDDGTDVLLAAQGETPSTWVWRGRWERLVTDDPTARTGASLVFDAANGVATMVGGLGADGSADGATWVFQRVVPPAV
jgi:hypothetical protein